MKSVPFILFIICGTWMMEESWGSPALLQQVWDILSLKGPPIGLHLNPSKCEWTWLDRFCSDACPLYSPSGNVAGVSCVPLDEMTMLGTPIGPHPSSTTLTFGKNSS